MIGIRVQRLALFLALAPLLPGQEWGAWHLIGPFDHPQGTADIATATTVERDLKFLDVDDHGVDLGETHKGKAGREIRWKELSGTGGKLDIGPIQFANRLDPLEGVAAWHENAISYLYRTIDCPRELEVSVNMGSDDGMRVWLNGELLIDRAVPRGLNLSDHSLVLPLHPGRNHLLVKVGNGGGGYGYQIAPWKKIPQAAINGAIDRGVQMILRHQLLDGSWGGYKEYGDGLSAFAGYCLLKSGVPKSHPAIQRTRAFVLANPSPYTYSNCCELLFLCTLDDPTLEAEIEERLDVLIDWQAGSGLWAYPMHPTAGNLPDDLSNTLYVALAFRACEQYGVEVPKRVWTRLLEGTMRCFEGMPPRKAVESGPTLGPPAGFAYRPQGNPTGSMTTAGVSVIEICRQGLGGELPGKFRGDALRAKRAGLSWLADNMRWSENPGQGAGHHYFFIYGMERVGSILELEHVGGVNWYWDGAAYLVRAQLGSGGWVGDEDLKNTILALLFLRRASAPVSGEERKAPDRWVTENEGAKVRIAASGALRTSMWILGFGEAEMKRLEFPSDKGRGPRLVAARYFARKKGEGDFEMLGEVRAREPKARERLAIQRTFPSAGEWELYAEVDVQVPATDDVLTPEVEELLSPVLTLRVADTLTPEQLEYAGHREENLLYGADVPVSASSVEGGHVADHLRDGIQETSWRWKRDDSTPHLRLAIGRPVKANTLLLSHAQSRRSRAHAPQAAKLEVIVNGKETFEFTLDPDPMKKSVLSFGEDLRVRELVIKVREVRGGTLGACSGGFAELELLRKR